MKCSGKVASKDPNSIEMSVRFRHDSRAPRSCANKPVRKANSNFVFTYRPLGEYRRI